VTSVALDELQEPHLAQQRELDSMEGAIIALEDGLAASECALGPVCMECDAERAQAEAVWQDYLAWMHAFMANCWNYFPFDWVLEERWNLLFILEMNLERREAKLAEEQARGLHSPDK
jgi:hypothetical protein